MNIKKVSQYAAGSVQNPKGPATKAGGEDKTQAPGVSADKVNFSNHYQLILQAKKVIVSSGEIRTDKVVHIRSQLENRTYVVNPGQVADKMLDEVL